MKKLYRAAVIPLFEGHRQEDKKVWRYREAYSSNQALRYLMNAYPYPKFFVEQPVEDLRRTKTMDLKEWNKLSPEEQKTLWEDSLATSAPIPSRLMEPTPAQCSAGLIELRNSLKLEIQDEAEASTRYKEASTKLHHYDYPILAQALDNMSQDEHQHKVMLEVLIDYLTEKCGK